MNFLPIQTSLEANAAFIDHPDCQESLAMTLEYYKIIGYHFPWVCYFVEMDGEIVANAAFKGQPVAGRVEIAYGTMEQYQHQGIGAAVCRKLVEIALATDPGVQVTARTLMEPNFSTRILQKNGFQCLGIVNDPDDGEVWEWEYQGALRP
jgi:RimJ/RimL family protein N-acetyltransferase